MKYAYLVVIVIALLLKITETTVAQNVEYLSSIGGSKTGNPLIRPRGIAVDSAGSIYVASSSGTDITVFDSGGNYQYCLIPPEVGGGGIFDVDVSPEGNIHCAYHGEGVWVFDSAGNYLWNAELPDTSRCIGVDDSGKTYIDDGIGSIYVYDNLGQFQFQFGSPGNGPGELDRPHGIAFNSQGHVHVAGGSNDRVQVFDNSGNYLFQFGTSGTGDGQFDFPDDVAIDENQRIYVADWGNDRVQVFDDEGNYLFKFDVENVRSLAIDNDNRLHVGSNTYVEVYQIPGTDLEVEFLFSYGNTTLYLPRFVTKDGDGKIYVTDSEQEVSVFSSDGMLLYSFGEAGQDDGHFDRPRGIAVSDVGQIYVSDEENDRVQVFENDGTFLFSFGIEGNGSGQLDGPTGLALDGLGKVHVADSRNDRVSVFDNQGCFQFDFGSEGTGNGQFDSPNGIVVDASGDIYVVDTGNDRVQVFDGSGAFLRTFGSTGTSDGKFDTPVGIALDDEENIYVTDQRNNRVQVFSNAGEFQFAFGTIGCDGGDLLNPLGINVSDNLIYVCAASLGRVEVYRIVGDVLLGDVNLDGEVNLLDVQPFVVLLQNSGYQAEADINQDGVVDLLDVQPFVDLLAERLTDTGKVNLLEKASADLTA